jgi:hypothetical protein
MNREAVIYAAEQIRELVDPDNRIEARQDPNGDTVHHFLWMCDQITTGAVTGRKAHRWLGYLQCAMVFSGEEHLSLEAMKQLSREAIEHYPEPEKWKHHEYEQEAGVIIGAEYVYPSPRSA